MKTFNLGQEVICINDQNWRKIRDSSQPIPFYPSPVIGERFVISSFHEYNNNLYLEFVGRVGIAYRSGRFATLEEKGTLCVEELLGNILVEKNSNRMRESAG